MPNWTWNRISCKKSIGDKILEKTSTGYKLDFNKLIPMPETLKMVAGSIEDMSVANYYLSLDKKQKRELEDLLSDSKVFFYGNYWNKYFSTIKEFEKDESYRKKCIEPFEPNDSDFYKKFDNINDLGKQYIDNIKEYGYSQWYDWCNEKWGTKWNVGKDVDVEYDSDDEKYSICFNTAWSPPYGIIKEYSILCSDDEFYWEYENEDYDGHHILTKEGNNIIDSVIDYEEDEEEGIDIC